MRIIKILFVIFVVFLLVLGVTVTILVRSFDINRHKDAIAGQISQQIDREVTIGRLGLEAGLTQGLGLKIEDLTVAGDPAFSNQDFLTADEIRFNLDILSFISNRKLVVSRIALMAPKVNLVRRADGGLNIPGLAGPDAQNPTRGMSAGKPEEKPSRGTSAQNPEETSATQGSRFNADIDFTIHLIKVENGSVTWLDKSQGRPRRIKAEKVEIKINDFSLKEPFSIEAGAAVLSPVRNVTLKGKGRVLLEPVQIIFTDGTLSADIGAVDLASLEETFPEAEPAGLKSPLKGQMEVTIDRLEAAGTGLVALSARGALKKGALALQAVPVPVEDIALDFDLTEERLQLTDFAAGLSSGRVTGRGRVDDYLKQPAADFDMSLKEIPLGDLLPAIDPKTRFTGQLDGQANVTFTGKDPEAITRTLAGSLEARIDEARLENINVLRLVLNRMSFIPNLADKLYRELPGKYKKQLEKDETVFEDIQIEVTARDGVARVQKGTITADSFTLQAGGSADFKGNLDLKGSLNIPADLSQSMVRAVEELQYILEDDGRIMIPFKAYQGPASSFRLMPDLSYLTKRMLVNRGGAELEKFFDKVFDREEKSQDQPATEGQEPAPGATPPAKSPERQLIENILDLL